jgi:aurora kinase
MHAAKHYQACCDCCWLYFCLLCCRPPFEVEDEAQTAALIMYSDAIKFPPNRTPQWTEFVKAALVKSPEVRPTATALLKHPW